MMAVECSRILADQVSACRQRIIDVLVEIDRIELQVNPQIQARYAKTVGYLEQDLSKWRLRARRLKRKATLLQAHANRGESIDDASLEARLDDEFREWEASLARALQEHVRTLEMSLSSRLLSPSDERAAKELHRTLVKRLHPDIHPGQSEEATRFFYIAQAAFENGDLAMLKAVAVATEDFDAQDRLDAYGASEDELEIDLAAAEAQLAVVLEQLFLLKKSEPYSLLDLLDDPQRLASVRSKLKAMIDQQKQAARAYEKRITELYGRN